MKTFQEQYNKLVKAYMNDEVNAGHHCACFVGNLLNNNEDWHRARIILGIIPFRLAKSNCEEEYLKGKLVIDSESDNTYTVEEIIAMESSFMNMNAREYPSYEDALFASFERTLLLLRQIHESKGEVIKDYTFTKRELKHELV